MLTLLFQFRYTTAGDKCILLVGALIAIVTGCGFPFMSILVGNISETFVKAQILYNAKEHPLTGAGTVTLQYMRQ
jgi:hypothetical protein